MLFLRIHVPELVCTLKGLRLPNEKSSVLQYTHNEVMVLCIKSRHVVSLLCVFTTYAYSMTHVILNLFHSFIPLKINYLLFL